MPTHCTYLDVRHGRSECSSQPPGSTTESKGYTLCVSNAHSVIPRSTVHRKLKHPEKLGLTKLKRGQLAIASDEFGRSVLARKRPDGKTITDRHVNHILDLL